MKFFYCRDLETEKNLIIIVGLAARLYETGIKPYKSRHGANAYLRKIAGEAVKLPPEPNGILKREPGESDKAFENRAVGDFIHVGYFERIFPKDPKESLDTPKTFYKSRNVFPPSDIWYENEKEAKKENDGIDTIYLGPVEVYAPEEIEKIEAEIASYPEY